MGSQWVHELVTMADAILVTADEAQQQGRTCKFCGAAQAGTSTEHGADCPVTLATRVIAQANDARKRNTH